ncbi:Mei2-like C-terminal RNA recognition motif-containing protein [Dioscorea alata]|uniref:Mei2-like C-terminal RNA recognition motif-containing protein n=1 Tax=Dioscorea alata TaxID=55571 RepID=A0ACB7UH66_DIOAL|nr:Mei2-like C-terminal RNA recognition motif-containing protein [Dioscorea alata]
MIKNLPNKLMKSTLLQMLDDHCAQENKDTEENSTVSEFNFLYLPIDFKSGSNLGYAFVNFTSAKAARRFYHAFHNKSWNQLHGSLKICEVTYARIQGLPALQKRFKNSVFICDNEDYLPVYFNPSRNGSCDSKQHFIGRKIMKL